MTRIHRMSPAILVLLGLCAPAFGQEYRDRAYGGIVVVDEAAVYKKSRGDEIAWKLKRGDSVAAQAPITIAATLFTPWPYVPPRQFWERDGRVQVLYLQEGKRPGRLGWVDVADLARFSYEGTCGPGNTPFTVKGHAAQWNTCFQEARDAKLAELSAPRPATAAPAAQTAPSQGP